MDDSEFYRQMPKIELHAHLNGSISPLTMKKLLDLHRKLWPAEQMPEDSETMIEKGSVGTIDDPFRMFAIVHTVTDNVDAIKMATHDVIKEFADDGVKYLELRSTPRAVPDRMTTRDYCDTIIGEIEKANSELEIKVKLILAIDRRKLEACDETLQLFVELKKLHPDIMAGIDLSGDPRVGEASMVLPTMKKARDLGIPLAIHLAEIYNHEETLEFLKFKPDRLGHGTCIHPSLGGHPELWDQLTKHPIPVEVCISSNVTCQTVACVKDHQTKLLHDAGVPIVLCTDDKGVFLCSLSGEYKLAANTFNWSRNAMWNISLAAIEVAFCTAGEKEQLKSSWKEWRSDKEELFNN